MLKLNKTAQNSLFRTLLVLLLILCALALCLDRVSADTPPTMPHVFYGTVFVNGATAGPGRIVSSYVDGVFNFQTATDSQGRYGYASAFYVTSATVGQTVSFCVDGQPAPHSSPFSVGGVTHLDLMVNITMPPTVTTSLGTSITTNSATLNGNLTSFGTSDNAAVSFQFGTSLGIYTDNTSPKLKTIIGTFSHSLTGLQATTTYYYRAKATANGSTAYGTELSFTTSGVPSQITTTTNTGTLTLQSNLGNITSFSAIGVQTLPNLPPLLVFPHGLMYFEVTNITPGSTVTFTIKFPITLPANIQYWKYQPGHGWFQIPITSHNGNVITIQITDGGLGDADGLANSVIIDPGGIAVVESNIGTGAPTSHGSSVAGTTTMTQPVSLPSIQIQSASLSAYKVAPGTPVTVTANLANRGTVNGSTRLKLYVNGEEDSSQGVTVESGGSRPVYFTVSRNEPATYAVYIGGTLAGSFTVDDAIDPNIVLYISLSLIAISLMFGVIMIAKRKSYY
jgi:hypothetical protein